MERTAVEQQRFRSLEVLFGAEMTVSAEFLDYLQVGGLKAAFRKRAMETHPDRMAAGDFRRHPADHYSFHAVRAAYENLLGFLQTRDVARRNASSCHIHQWQMRRSGPFPAAGRAFRPIILPADPGMPDISVNTERLYQGGLPARPLLFGHFLYYGGLTNWRTIARVLIWQRLGRPRLGELGLRAGIFSKEDVASILRHTNPEHLFGQTARRLGIATDNTVQRLIDKQKRLQKKFGMILVENDLINHGELRELLRCFRHHNTHT
ncbi:MAG: hypothetical protein P4L42_06215 [Desulfocapsaceae bacterium]|nr:hypothetical protein [Desulfocapsaceae bacterium]